MTFPSTGLVPPVAEPVEACFYGKAFQSKFCIPERHFDKLSDRVFDKISDRVFDELSDRVFDSLMTGG
jgi:hypothetical protein